MRIICRSSWPRAALALCLIGAFPVALIIGIQGSGYNVADYFGLLARGQLSIFRQAVGWLGFVLFAAWYGPSAIVALRHRNYLAADETYFYLPTMKVALSEIMSLDIRKNFVHRILTVRRSTGDLRSIVTFANCSVSELCDRLKADAHLGAFVKS